MNSQRTDFKMEVKEVAPQSYCLEIKGTLEFLKLVESQIQKQMQETEEQFDVSIQRRWCSLFMNLFLKTLKSKNPNNPLLQQLLAYRNNMPSKQKKLEQGCVSDLLTSKTMLGRDFKIQWLEFLSSPELKVSIQKSHKIQSKYKNKYVQLIDKVIAESNSEKPFYKFMSKHKTQIYNKEKNNAMNLIDEFEIDDDIIFSGFNQTEREQTWQDQENCFEQTSEPFYKRTKIE